MQGGSHHLEIGEANLFIVSVKYSVGMSNVAFCFQFVL